MGQYEGRFGEAGTYRVTAQAYATHFHSAGIIREDDYQSGRIGFYDSYDLLGATREQVPEGGDASRYSLAGDFETRAGDVAFAQQAFLIKRDMRLLENFTGFLLDVQEPLQSLHAQRGDMLDLDVHELTVGARGSARWHGQWLGQRQELELGYFARGDDAAGTQQRLEADNGVPYKTETDLDSQIGDIALYGDANLRPWRWLSLRGGGRGEILTYAVLNNCAAQTVNHPSTSNPPINESCLTQQDMGRPREPDQRSSTSTVTFLPRASLIVGPFRDVTLSASYGRGIRSIDPSYITQDIKTPFASVRSYEAGAVYAGSIRRTSLVARTAVFQTVVDQDLIFSETAGRNVLGSGTTRTGWLGALRWTGPFFDESANLTLVSATFNDNSPGRRLRARHGLSLRHRALRAAPLAPRRTAGPHVAHRGHHLRRAAASALWRGQRGHLHRRRRAHGQLVALPAAPVGDQRARQAVSARRVQLRLRLQEPAAADAGPRARVHRRSAARGVRHLRNQPGSFVMATERSSRCVALRSRSRSRPGAGCVGNAGGQSIDFPVAAAGPEVAVAGQPLACSERSGLGPSR